MKNKVFIVPHDFTSVADNALNHALATAKIVSGRIFLLHVVAKDKEIKDAEQKLADLIAALDTTIDIDAFVRVGNIFEDIGEFASEHHADLIFMGTHGRHGWQHITGSHALKVITQSTVPFIVVQEKGIKETGYDDIVVPLDLNKETKQKLAYVANIAIYFKSKVHVITPDETDEYLRHQVKANIQFAVRFFKERNIEITTKVAPKSGFDKEVVKHAVALDADLIAIMNLNRNNLFGVITANYEQYIITNDAQIPTLIVNPIESPYGSSVLFG
ncbi:MAG: universal stress protein [Flavobacteriia bacterium]|jgi:nucleotide-binding universal stress UspA family protein